MVGRQGCPAPGPLPLIWTAARVVPCPSPIPTPSFLSGRMFPLLSGRFRRLMRPKHVTPLRGDEVLGREEPESGLRAKGGAGNGTSAHRA